MKIRIEKTVATLLVFILYSSILMSANLIKISAVMGAQSDWPMFRHDLDHTGYTTSTGPTTNSYIWIHPIGNWVQSSPAVVNDVVYVGSSDGNVYALSTIDGSLVWSYPTGAAVLSCPAVADGVVYVGSGDFNVYALDAASGTKLWNYPTDGAVSSSPAVDGGVVFVSSFDGNVYALNAASGTKLWNFSAGFEYSSPAVDGGVVYVGSTNGNVYALNAADGTKLWNYTTGSWVQSSPAVVNDVVYVGSQDGKVYALNAATGAFVWSYATDYIINSSPAVVNDVVYVGSEEYGPTPHKVYALSTIDGSLVWSYLTDDNVVSSPAVAGGIVYIGSDDGYVYALNAVTGDFVWSCETSGGQSSPAVSNGIVYVGAKDGKIYAIGPSGPLASFAVDTLHEATPIAHQSFDIMVTAEDALYNVVTDYTGTVHFSSSDSLAVLPSDYTFTTSDNGVHTFPITFNTAGSQDLKVSDLASSVSNTPSWTVLGLTIINTVDIPPSSDWNYVIVADSSEWVPSGTVVESFTLPAGGGNMTFSDPVFTDGGIFNITAIPKFGYTTDISTQQYDDYSYSVIGDFNATLNLHYKSAMTVTFTNAGMSAFATQYLGQAPPSDLNIQLPALKPIPVQSSWTVDISGNTIPDLVLGKPMAVLVSLAGSSAVNRPSHSLRNLRRNTIQQKLFGG